MDYLNKIITDFELHNVQGIKDCFSKGLNPNEQLEGKPLIYSLINMYTRGPHFKDCIQAFADHGLEFEDKALLYVLLDNAPMLDSLLTLDPGAISRRYTLDGTFTPLFEVSLLHICAEYNHCNAAITLFKHGADINAMAGVDPMGFGGQTPVFHTVNQDANKSLEMLNLLISKNADLTLTIKGLLWGKGYPWETFIPAVNPISYAMMGLLRQFQRTEKQIYEVVSLLLKARYGIEYTPSNIPNKYLYPNT